jgi:hypothetical protein
MEASGEKASTIDIHSGAFTAISALLSRSKKAGHGFHRFHE